MGSGGVGVSSRSGPCSSWGAGRQRPTRRRSTRRSARSSGSTAGSTASCRADATIERLAEGFDWAEGPVWDRSGGYLLFSDVPRNTVFKWKEGEQGPRLPQAERLHRQRVTGGGEPGANGLVLDPQGRLVLCQHGDRRVARLEADGRFTTLADRYLGKRLNSPNDAVYKPNGDLYFTDPPYGLPGQERRPGQGARLQRRLPALEGRQADAADQGDDLPQRHRLLARREDALRRELRPEEGDLDGVRRARTTARSARGASSPTRPRWVGRARRACPTA